MLFCVFFVYSFRYPPGYFIQNLQFDFFNYAGIHRRVRLYTTPKNDHVDDISIVPSVDLDTMTGKVNPKAQIQIYWLPEMWFNINVNKDFE